jgi:hypothetical protein
MGTHLQTTPKDGEQRKRFDGEQHQRKHGEVVVQPRGKDDDCRNGSIDRQYRRQPFLPKLTPSSKKGEKGKEYAPLALDRGSAVRVVGKRGVHQEEGRRERPDRVGRRGGRESTEDGREGYECEEDEQGCLDRART